jgi:hypothetical protein
MRWPHSQQERQQVNTQSAFPRFLSRLSAPLLAALLACGLVPVAQADQTDDQAMQGLQQSIEHPCSQFDTPEWKEAMAVKLTAPMVKAVNAIDADLDKLKTANPAIASKLLDVGLDTLKDTTIDKQAAGYQGIPEVAAILKHHGLSAHQYLIDKFAVLAAMVIAVTVETDADMARLKADKCDVDNVVFFKAHADELMQPPQQQ